MFRVGVRGGEVRAGENEVFIQDSQVVDRLVMITV